MARALALLKYFVFQVALVAVEEVWVVITFLGFLDCSDLHWACWTIALPFVPGLVAVVGFAGRALLECSSRDNRDNSVGGRGGLGRRCFVDSLKYTVFPVFHLVRNTQDFCRMIKLDESSPEYSNIWISSASLKLMKAVLESTAQSVLQLAIAIRSCYYCKGYFPTLLTSAWSLLSLCFAAQHNFDIELFQLKSVEAFSHLSVEPSLRSSARLLPAFLAIAVPRVLAWGLVLSFCGIYTVAFVAVCGAANWAVSWSVPEVGRGWKLYRPVVCLVDALSSIIVPVFPQSMRRLAVSNLVLGSASLGVLCLLLETEQLQQSLDPKTERHLPILICYRNVTEWKGEEPLHPHYGVPLLKCVPPETPRLCAEGEGERDELFRIVVPVILGLLCLSTVTIFLLFRLSRRKRWSGYDTRKEEKKRNAARDTMLVPFSS